MKSLTIILFIITGLFFYLLVINSSYQRNISDLEKLSTGFFSDSAIHFITSKEKIDEQELKNNLPDKSLLYANIESNYDLRAIYFNFDIDYPKLGSGRFFTSSEIIQSEKYAVVGSEIDLEIDSKNQEFLNIFDEKYLVIGKIDYGFPTRLDRTVIVPINQTLLNNDVIKFVIDSNELKENYNYLGNQELFGNVMTYDFQSETLLNITDTGKNQDIVNGVIIGILTINLLVILIFIFKKSQSTWYYKSSLGWERQRVYFEFFKIILGVISVSCLVGSIFIYLTRPLNMEIRVIELITTYLSLLSMTTLIVSGQLLTDVYKGGKVDETSSLLMGQK